MWWKAHGLESMYGGATVECASTKYSNYNNHPEWKATVAQAASDYLEGDQAILIAIIAIESSWDPNAVSGSTVGLGQFMPDTALGLRDKNGNPVFNNVNERTDPIKSIIGTAIYFKVGLDKYRDQYPDKLRLYRVAYAEHYNTSYRKLEAAADVLEQYNSMLADGSCKSSSGGGSGGWHWVLGQEVQETNPRYTHSCFKPWAIDQPFCAADYGQAEGGKGAAPVFAITGGTITFRKYTDYPDPYLYRTSGGARGGYNADFISTDKKIEAIYAHIYKGGITLSADLSRPVQVKGGDQFAEVYNEPVGMSPHLHFELYVRGMGLILDSNQLSTYKQLSQNP